MIQGLSAKFIAATDSNKRGLIVPTQTVIRIDVKEKKKKTNWPKIQFITFSQPRIISQPLVIYRTTIIRVYRLYEQLL